MFGSSGPMAPLAGWTVSRPTYPRLEEIEGPTTKCITLNDLKTHLRITHNEEDTYLESLIDVATNSVERYLSRRIMPQKVRMWLDMIPGTGNDIPGYGAGVQSVPVRYANIGMFRFIELMGLPVKSFESFQFYTLANELMTYEASNYLVDNHDPDITARVVLQYGSVWPVNLRVSQALCFNYTLGYTSVPFPIRHAVKMMAAAMFSNRGDAADATLEVMNMPAVLTLLSPYRIMKLGTL